jgi:hypothetical protein
MNVLICSQHGELQVDEVSQLLKNIGLRPIMFERYRKDQFICYQYGKKITACLRIDEEIFPLNSKVFPVVWYRPKPIILSELPGEVTEVKEKFCIQEWRVILQSLDLFLSESKWVNPILFNQKASNKAIQLKVASELGLKIPDTMITNDVTQALSLFKHDRVIYKTLSYFLSSKEAIYTNEIDQDQMLKAEQEIAMAPGIFQECIDKDYELRVTLVGDDFFIVRINSQLLNETSIDWRRKPGEELYESGDLTSNTKEKLLRFHKHFGLIYAAYDFIVDKKGNEIFVECNPSGQWLWLDNIFQMSISQAMVNQLANF